MERHNDWTRQGRSGRAGRQSIIASAAALTLMSAAYASPQQPPSPSGQAAPAAAPTSQQPAASDTAAGHARDGDTAHDDTAHPAAPVLTGIDVLAEIDASPLRGSRIGLITNHTGRTRGGRSTIDVLATMPDVELRALFGPEHGIRGAEQAGVGVDDDRDPATGLPIHSLYDRTRAPTIDEMVGLDALVFDMQDVGSRYYTYVWTMALAMRAAGEHGLRFVVLDRPNPIGGHLVQGNVLDPEFASFLGMFPVPMRHGLTAGELARMLAGEFGIQVQLDVVPVANWTRAVWFDDTDLEWIAPSPNMPTLESALHYPGTCLFEQTSLSVGRGLPTAFQQIGAPWLDHLRLAEHLNELGMPGVRFEPVRFPAVTPERQSHLGEMVPGERRGVRFIVTDRGAYDPVHAALEALVWIQRMQPDRLEFATNFDAIAGTDRVRTMIEAGASARDIMQPWRRQIARFERLREPYLLYPTETDHAPTGDER